MEGDSKKDETKENVSLNPKVTSLRDVPIGAIFRLEKSGTIYVKMPDGSIRNATKAAKKLGLIPKRRKKHDHNNT